LVLVLVPVRLLVPVRWVQLGQQASRPVLGFLAPAHHRFAATRLPSTHH
jgi:hypothetical protein